MHEADKVRVGAMNGRSRTFWRALASSRPAKCFLGALGNAADLSVYCAYGTLGEHHCCPQEAL